MSICAEDDLVSIEICRALVKPDQPQIVLVFFSDNKAVVIEIANVHDSLLVELFYSFFASFNSQNPPLVFLNLNYVDKFVQTQILLNNEHIITRVSSLRITLLLRYFLDKACIRLIFNVMKALLQVQSVMNLSRASID